VHITVVLYEVLHLQLYIYFCIEFANLKDTYYANCEIYVASPHYIGSVTIVGCIVDVNAYHPL
jgi:hypothetical protein